METENLNLITRRELLDSQKQLDPKGAAAMFINALLMGEPRETSSDSRYDVFEIDFQRDTLEEIAYAVEQHAWEMAEGYVVEVEDDTSDEMGSARFYYWQALSERWHYLEMMR